ncbi:MAG TPA: DUF1592 domain-containing protein [Polyangiaceae bacterium]|nr:DUF1592 domain-containing protein [Polyangiaceae bacterium]
MSAKTWAWARASLWVAALTVGASVLACGSTTVPERSPSEKDGGPADGGPTVSVGCPDDVQYFRDRIWPTLSVQCIGCHNASGLAKTSRLILLRADNQDTLPQNFETVRKLALEKQGSTSIFVLRPSGKFSTGHPGGTIFSEGSATYADFQTFTERVAGDGSNCGNGGPRPCGEGTANLGPRQLRRLTRLEYDNTIHDLFQVDSAWGASFPPDDVVDGFDGNAAALRVGPLLADKYGGAADEIAAVVARDPSKLAPCAANGDDACAATLISDVGARIFRRPLTTGESMRYQALYKIGAVSGFADGVKLVLAAMLQSPTFLYRSELGVRQSDGTYALTPYEIASELSYLFWATIPDAELSAAARDGSLSNAVTIAAQARRLLASPRSRSMLDHFAAQWLDLDRLAQVVKDETIYPGFTAPLRAAMRAETLALFDFVVHAGTGKLPELLTAPYSFVNDDLAAFYGIDAPPPDDGGVAGLRKVGVASAHRGGLLTQGSILASQAKPTMASPIHRGKLVRERLLCQNPTPPPPGLNAQLPPVDPKLSNRERFTAHAKNEPCASCHRLMDPIGFAFEAFDGIGKYVGAADTSGQIVDSPHTDATFNGPLELGQLLAASSDVERCFSLEWFRYASGLKENQDLSCLIDDVAGSFSRSGASLPDLFVALTQTAHFRLRRGNPDGAPSLPGIDGGGPTPPPPPTDAGAPRDAGTPTSPDVTVSRKTDSQWDKGYCDAVTVTNQGMSGVDWVIVLTVEGTMNQVWNAVATGATGPVTFRGVDFNKHLEPGQSSSFGFCVAR